MAVKNPWHDVEVGREAPEVINAVIEISKNSKIKYELDKESGLLKLDRFLYSAVHYPGDYGFIPKTLWEDNDPLDILILTGHPILPMTLAKVRVLGVLKMLDGDELDDKLIAVYEDDPRYKEFRDIQDVPSHIMKEIIHFFETYKELQGKKCSVPEVLGREEAIKIIDKSIDMYNQEFS